MAPLSLLTRNTICAKLAGLAAFATCIRVCLAAPCANVSLDPPGGLAPADTPQMILITFDDSINTTRFEIVQQILTNRVNPNGTPIQATFFVTTDWTDYWSVHRLHAQGHEIALHTMTHTTSTQTVRTVWRAEIAGGRRALARFAGIPAAEIRGFRAPFLDYNNDSFQVLREQALTYDASIIEQPGHWSQSPSRMIWPYTLDQGVQQNCLTGPAPEGSLPGLFEIPLWSLYDPDDASWVTMDPPGNDSHVMATLQTNFVARYHGNRAPLGLFLHAADWKDRPQVLRDFLDWAQTFQNVWIVSLGALTDFMQSPQSTVAAHTFPPFITATYAEIPESAAPWTRFAQGSVRTCGEIPLDYPGTETIYLVSEAYAGGVITFEITGDWQTNFNARLTVSNDTTHAADDWNARCDLPGCTVTWLSGPFWEQEGSTLFLTAKYPRTLAAGQAYSFTFGATKNQPVQALNKVLTLYEHLPMRPKFSSISRTDAGQIRLDWNDSAFGYAVEQKAGGFDQEWQPACEVHGATHWTSAVPPSASSRFYRITTIP